MSLTRQFMREMRPLFRMFEEPLRTPAYMGFPAMRSMLDEPFFQYPTSLRPAVDISEQGNNYIVEAELPGVKKENVQVRIGDGGRSVTIEGKVVRGEGQAPAAAPTEGEAPAAPAQGAEGTQRVAETVNATEDTSTGAVTESAANQLSSERSFVGAASFTRTVWLPRQADPAGVTAKLNDGVLTVTIPKATDPGSVQVTVQ